MGDWCQADGANGSLICGSCCQALSEEQGAPTPEPTCSVCAQSPTLAPSEGCPKALIVYKQPSVLQTQAQEDKATMHGGEIKSLLFGVVPVEFAGGDQCLHPGPRQ